jgi:uncharacterized membrane protein (DUF2068 family)
MATTKRDRGIELIALFKMVKALVLILAGMGMLTLLRPAAAAEVRDWLAAFTVARGQHIIHRALMLLDATPLHLGGIGVASICYGLLFATEGVGLWLERRWAEYLTVFTTGSLIPFEIYELVRKVSWLRVVALVINVAAVVYLVVRLRQRTGGRHGHR